MTIQYNVPIKVIDSSQKSKIEMSLQPYRIFTDRSGNLDGTCFSYESFPCIGEFVIVKTIKKEAAQTAYEILKGIEGLIVLPITEYELEKDKKRIARMTRKKTASIQ